MEDNIEHNAAVLQAAITLLPFLLSIPPFVPSSLTSEALNWRHRTLNISPEDVEEYLVTDFYRTGDTTPARSVELLHQLASQIEQLSATNTIDSGPRAVLGEIAYKVPDKDLTIVSIQLGDTRQAPIPLLQLLLKLEGDPRSPASYKYDNLLPMNVVPGPWHTSLEDAKVHQNAKFEKTQPGFFQVQASTTSADIHEPMTGYAPIHAGEPHPSELSAPEYITDPKDFWAGTSSDDDSAKQENTSAPTHKYPQTGLDEEERYWTMYDSKDTAAGTSSDPGRNDEAMSSAGELARVLRQSSATRVSQSKLCDQGGSNFDKSPAESISCVERQREYGRWVSARNESIKLIMKGAWRLMEKPHPLCYSHEGRDAVERSAEADFLRLAKEAVQEYRADEVKAIGGIGQS